jgi:hypothetical protein
VARASLVNVREIIKPYLGNRCPLKNKPASMVSPSAILRNPGCNPASSILTITLFFSMNILSEVILGVLKMLGISLVRISPLKFGATDIKRFAILIFEVVNEMGSHARPRVVGGFRVLVYALVRDTVSG